MFDLQCLTVQDLGNHWLVRCRCGAGWLPSKDNPNPGAIIAHALTHRKRLNRLDELCAQIRLLRAA